MINCCDLALLLEVITFKYNCLLVRNKWINTICTTSPCYLHIRLLRDLFIYLFENPIQLKDLSLRKKKHVSPSRCYTTAIKERTRGIILENVGRKDFPDFLRNYPVSREEYTTKHIETAYISSLSLSSRAGFTKPNRQKKMYSIHFKNIYVRVL